VDRNDNRVPGEGRSRVDGQRGAQQKPITAVCDGPLTEPTTQAPAA